MDQLEIKLQRFNHELTTKSQKNNNQELEADQKPTDRVKKLDHQLKRRSELLRQSAHDLKSNFTIVQASTDLLIEAQTDADRQQMKSMLKRNFNQATHLLTQLLDVTRLEAGEEHRQLTQFNVADLLDKLVKNIRPLADKKNLWVRGQGVCSLLVEGDSVKIYRIAQNLLINAIKYTNRGGVTVKWMKKATDKWSLTVTDTGPGLSNKGHHASGEGIGLLIVRQLCTLLAGKFLVKEPKGGGTQFVLTFPLRYS